MQFTSGEGLEIDEAKKDLKRSKKGATRLVLFSYVIFLNNCLLIAIRHSMCIYWDSKFLANL